MGIPRLSQDTLPYAENVYLGRAPRVMSQPGIDRLVIDGPSLVYHVYNKLWLYCQRLDVPVPSYASIDTFFLRFLGELQMCGVEVLKIYFDGGLPVAKRNTRQARLERTRQQLENVRKVLAAPPATQDAHELPEDTTILWCTDVVSGKVYLPHPPFMVAGVIEAVLQSPYRDLVEVVPGEADSYCANKARSSGAAVLSNDSDLLMHDLGDRGCVVSLHSLQMEVTPVRDHFIKAQCLRPHEIARQIGVSSLLEYGFQRFLDGGARQSVIIERTKKFAAVFDSDQSWADFRKEYSNILRYDEASDAVQSASSSLLAGLDPRLAELVTSLRAEESMHSYMPIIFEDHSKDSSWSYGNHIRRLAYSLLCCGYRQKVSTLQRSHVDEHVRRGAQIIKTRVELLSRTEMKQQLADFIHLHEQYFGCSKDPIHAASKVFEYHLLSAQVVAGRLIIKGKSYADAIWRLFSCHATKFVPLSWNDVHLLANIHAVLYSIRILKQALQHSLRMYDWCNDDIESDLKICSSALEDVPALAELIIDAPTLRRQQSLLDRQSVERGIQNMLTQAELQLNTNNIPAQNTADDGHLRNRENSGQTDLSVQNKRARKRNKTAGRKDATRPLPVKQLDKKPQVGTGQNLFNILSIE